MGSTSLVSGGILLPQPDSWRRATSWNLNSHFNRILILLTLTTVIIICIFLYANNNYSIRPERIIVQKLRVNPEETRHTRNEASAAAGHELELVRNLSRDGAKVHQVDPLLMRNLIRNGAKVPQDDPMLVQHVKTHLLTPPSSLPYNLVSKLNNTSQLGQNIVALGLLQNKTNGFFIECGAGDGEGLSNSLLLERDFGWTGILIEANPQLAYPLRQKNRKAWTSSACLSTIPFAQVMKFYMPARGTGINSLISNSTSMNKVYRLKMTTEESVEILCIPLYTYLLALNVEIVDYLSLDVEAADFDVLQTIPFDKIIFRVLEVEVEWVNEGKEAVRAFLETKGYIWVRAIWPDYIFAHHSILQPKVT